MGVAMPTLIGNVLMPSIYSARSSIVEPDKWQPEARWCVHISAGGNLLVETISWR